MKDEIELLEYIYQNAKMGQETIGRIMATKNIETKFESQLEETLNNYKKIAYSSKNMLLRRKKKVKDITMGTKMAIYMSIKKSLSEDMTEKNIANKIYEASYISHTEIKEFVEKTKIKSKTILNLANRLLGYEEENVTNYKRVLEA